MPAPIWEHLSDFLDTDDFAVAATLHSQTGSPRQLCGLFDDPYVNTKIGEYEADASAPRFLCRQSDVRSVQRGDQMQIDGDWYVILTTPQFDGTGMATLKLAPEERL